MKEELIDKLIKEFIKDKDLIKQNLMLSMDNIILETKNEYGKLTLTIKYEKEKKNE